jgi:hypothetical protein
MLLEDVTDPKTIFHELSHVYGTEDTQYLPPEEQHSLYDAYTFQNLIGPSPGGEASVNNAEFRAKERYGTAGCCLP